MYAAVNCSVVTLLPKVADAKLVKDFRPISCCTTLYKIVSKVLTTRPSKVLPRIVNESQATFIPGQQIHNHILLAYELLRGYGRKTGAPKCMLQMDIQKAYDTVEWCALESILRELSFPPRFITWIIICVTTVSYKYMVNGSASTFLRDKRGLRQGDPISPLLFVLVMEYLYRLLQGLKSIPDFNFHARCEKLSIVNLSFADDLLLFSRGDVMSVKLVMELFSKFSRSTGLRVNPAKCQAYFGVVASEEKRNIQNITSFSERSLPFRYLGVPMTSKKLSVIHCQPLIDRIVDRIRH